MNVLTAIESLIIQNDLYEDIIKIIKDYIGEIPIDIYPLLAFSGRKYLLSIDIDDFIKYIDKSFVDYLAFPCFPWSCEREELNEHDFTEDEQNYVNDKELPIIDVIYDDYFDVFYITHFLDSDTYFACLKKNNKSWVLFDILYVNYECSKIKYPSIFLN